MEKFFISINFGPQNFLRLCNFNFAPFKRSFFFFSLVNFMIILNFQQRFFFSFVNSKSHLYTKKKLHNPYIYISPIFFFQFIQIIFNNISHSEIIKIPILKIIALNYPSIYHISRLLNYPQDTGKYHQIHFPPVERTRLNFGQPDGNYISPPFTRVSLSTGRRIIEMTKAENSFGSLASDLLVASGIYGTV